MKPYGQRRKRSSKIQCSWMLFAAYKANEPISYTYQKPGIMYFTDSQPLQSPKACSRGISIPILAVIKVCQTQSADLSVFVLFFLFFYYSFLFFSTATCVLRFLHYFSTNLDEIWHVHSPWWDEQTEYFFKSIGPGVGIRRGPIVLLCFIIGKLYILCVEIRISLSEENFNEE